MKKVIAILFALALISGQPLSKAVASCGGASTPCCDCGGHQKCCVARSNDSSRETPAAPAPSSALKDVQLLQSLATGALFSFATPDHRVASHFIATPPASAVPLFTRDCAFLI